MSKKQIFAYVLWLLFCLIGGLVGSWLYDYSVNRYVSNFSGSALMSPYNQGSPLIIRDGKKIVVEQNEKIVDTINTPQAFLLGVFKKSANGQYDLSKAEAQALALTSDGWLISNLGGVEKDGTEGYVVIDKNAKIFKIDKRVDDASGLAFIHLVDASGLVVADFVKTKDLRVGQAMIVAEWLGESRQDVITKIDVSPSAIKSSDQPYKQIVSANKYETINPLVALDISGKVLGLFGKEKKLLASDYFVYKTGSLLANKKATIPVLGVNYLNLSWIAASTPASQGALLVKNGQALAVIKSSPAEAAGLLEGDVILSLDNLVISRAVDLADLLGDYRPGDKVIVKYLRAGREKSTEVVLAGK